jgi:hypothetical protein
VDTHNNESRGAGLSKNSLKAKTAAEKLNISISQLEFRLQSLGYLPITTKLDADTYISKSGFRMCDYGGQKITKVEEQ